MLEECRDECVNVLKYDKISKHWYANGLMLLFYNLCSFLCIAE
jgi:hypothetical protein